MPSLCQNARTMMTLFFLVMPAFNLHLFGQETRIELQRTDQLWANATQPLWEKEMHSSDFIPDLSRSLSEPAGEPQVMRGPLTVSVEELRHPVSRKGRKLLEKAEAVSRVGDHSKAIEELNAALKDPSAAPYAHGALGLEYVRLHRIADAIAEFEEAIALRPRSAKDHSNFGYALCVAGQIERGLGEIETALTLDQSLLKTRFLKGLILLDRDSHEHEAWANLQAAGREIPSAHLALALFYNRHGQGVAAQQQLQDYAQLGLGVTLAQAQDWLAAASVGVPAAEALGLWQPVVSSRQVEPGP
jgi:tetratricopeptide (TPR) repeat protein